MADSDRVAILLATYNGIDYLEEQICSIASQTHKPWHIFVRDDGSADGSVALLRGLLDPERLTVIDSSREIGGSPSRNFFAILKEVDLEAFQFVAFCDQDDIWAPRKLERAVKCLDETGAGGYSCNLVPFDNGTGKAWFLKKDFPEKEFDYIFQGASAGCTYVLSQPYSRLLQSKIGSILESPPIGFSHDWAIYAICRSFGYRWYQDAASYIFYRQHALNSFGALPSYKGLFKRLKLARSGWYRANILWLGGLLAGGDVELAILDRVRRFQFSDRLWLARRAQNFRRRGRDGMFFFVIASLGFM